MTYRVFSFLGRILGFWASFVAKTVDMTASPYSAQYIELNALAMYFWCKMGELLGHDSLHCSLVCGCSSAGRVPASQAGCREFDPRRPLH